MYICKYIYIKVYIFFIYIYEKDSFDINFWLVSFIGCIKNYSFCFNIDYDLCVVIF